MQSLTRTIYNEVHAQKPLLFITSECCLTEKSHGLCDTMDIRLLNNEILIRGWVALLGDSVMGSV